ncbi:MAG: adenine phosphoribosyltransferase [Leucothrix sp.]
MFSDQDKQELLNSIRNIPDYPKPGVQFKDITTLLNNPGQFAHLMDGLVARYESYSLDYIAGIDSRGFIFGAPLALRLGIGFVPIRKAGKLPSKTIAQSYSLEYGQDELEIHTDAFHGKAGSKVLLIDDLIATGGTAVAAVKLIDQLKAECIEACFLMSLEFLDGSRALKELTPMYSVLELD